MILDASKTDNISNFTKTGKAETASQKATNSLNLNYTTFIKLLTTQLKNQDPTKPVETDQLTQQFASLGQVEQGIATNQNLEKLVALFSRSQLSSNLSYIGKMVETTGNLGNLTNGTGLFLYNLDAQASKVDVTVLDRSGNVVFKGEGGTNAGRNEWVWNGKDNSGNTMPSGAYQIKVDAKDELGKVVKSSTMTIGRATSLETIDGKDYIALGDILVPTDEVLAAHNLREPTKAEVGHIGKLVEATGNLSNLSKGKAYFTYNLGEEAKTVRVTILDNNDKPVYSSSGTKIAGRNTFTWDGKDNSGKSLEDGTYKLKVEAVNAQNKEIIAVPSTTGIVTSIEKIDGLDYLAVGDILIPMDAVISVRALPA